MEYYLALIGKNVYKDKGRGRKRRRRDRAGGDDEGSERRTDGQTDRRAGHSGRTEGLTDG